MTNPRDIGARIRTAREEQGWTQDQLAAEVGVSRSAVAQWETGRAGQVTTNLTRVAAALGVGVEHLMYGRDKVAPGPASHRRRACHPAAVSRMRAGGPPAPAAHRAAAGKKVAGRQRRCAAATIDAIAHDASRASSESARLVRMIGTRAPSTIPAVSAPARNDRLLASMLPASRSGTTSRLARPATGETMCLIAAASGQIALSSASGPSSTAPVICPRSAILHSAAASIVDWIFGFTVSIADRIATRTSGIADCVCQVDGVLHDVDLVLERRRDVHRRIGDDQRIEHGRERP